MRIPVIEIGNSKGIRIPQAVLKQVSFGSEIEMTVTDGQITLSRAKNQYSVRDFADLVGLDDVSIQRVLMKISGSDLITALLGADQTVKESVYRNLADPVKEYLIPKVELLEKADAKTLMIELSRNRIAEAMIEVAKE